MKLKENLLLPLWVLFLVMFRPSVFGEKFNSLIFVFLFVVTVAILAIEARRGLTVSKPRLVLAIFIYACLSYFVIQGLILSDARSTVINSGAFLFLLMPCLLFIVNNHQEKILKLFINFHYLLSWSAVITFALFVMNGFSLHPSMRLMELDVALGLGKTDPNIAMSSHVIYFPFTFYWSTSGLLGYDMPRFIGIYREPGMAQIFLVTSLMLTFFVDVKNVKTKRFLLYAGSLLTFSASGLVNLVMGLAVLSVFNASVKAQVIAIVRKPWVIVFGLVVFIVLVRFAINMVNARLDDVSGDTRIEAFQDGLRSLSESVVFGKGYYNDFQKDPASTVGTINFIGIPGVSYQLGVVGLVLYFLCWLVSLKNLAGRQALCIYVPCLLTLMLSQPSYNDAFTWFIMFLDTRHFTLNS